MAKKIFFDFETTCKNPFKTNLVQATFIFANKYNKITNKINEHIKIKERYEDFNEEEKETLKEFHNITNQDELDEHNRNAITNEELLKIFEEKIKKILEEDDFKHFEFYGWNNSQFDNIIFLDRFAEVIEKTGFTHRFDDLKNQFYLMKDILKLIDYKELNNFREEIQHPKERGNTLELVYRFVVEGGNLKEFHNSNTDVLATYELYNEFEKMFKSSDINK